MMAAVTLQALAGQGSPSLLRKTAAKQPRVAMPGPRRRQSVAVRAAATGPGSPKRPGDLIQNVIESADTFLNRYDVLSCGMGALACTSFFVYNGQDPGTALQITIAATVAGLVANEIFFDEH